ncbi:hypothetical protein SOVF_129350 isoform A [Spinacia oleracea]|uniref:Lactoylglutathione lyase GLX1 isoform X4 n=1 Tax=Spinacia oleracea TaxID=3562 RepID=A0ABM3QUZ9_SPIOL|nr:lactoylglutathione lyase GLX1-like isoform X4 [Spinacia oleracea]KNA12055.1 hypothetical protein SOVF_129350 isoform A [Spinacia oleracea]
MVEGIRAKGGVITREPGPVKGGSTVIAFVKVPTGYIFELIQRCSTPEPLCQVMLRVGDLDCSIKFYEKVYMFAEWYKPWCVLEYPLHGTGAVFDAMVCGT